MINFLIWFCIGAGIGHIIVMCVSFWLCREKKIKSSNDDLYVSGNLEIDSTTYWDEDVKKMDGKNV